MVQSYQWEALSPQLFLCTSPKHRFGIDAFLLSDFAQVRRRDRAVDLGTGCGIVPLLWFREGGPQLAYGVDLQGDAIWQLEQAVQRNGLQNRLIPLQGDLREIRTLFPAQQLDGAFDLVTCNPPYFQGERSGLLSRAPHRQLARHDLCCTLEDVCAAARWLLKFGGRLCICQRPERLTDAICAMRAQGLEPKRLRLVQQRPHTAPWLFLLEGRRGAKPGLRILPPLVVQGEQGYSQEVLRIYGKEAHPCPEDSF